MFGAVGFPGAVDGYQVNFRVPTDTVKGAAAIELSAGWVADTPVKVMVQRAAADGQAYSVLPEDRDIAWAFSRSYDSSRGDIS